MPQADRTAPENSTSVGLLRLGLQMESAVQSQTNGSGSMPAVKIGNLLGSFFRRLLPDDEK